MKFAALCFETADETRFSVCQISISIVSNNEIIETDRYLVKPSCFPYFDENNIEIHGITPDDVADSPDFPEVWNEISDRLSGLFVLMHNTGFHASVLRHTLDHYEMDYPNIDFGCTGILAKKVLPSLGVYRFDFLAKHFGIGVDPEYPPKQSSERVAKLAINLLKNSETSNIEEFFTNNGIVVGRFAETEHFSPCLSKRKYRTKEEKYGLDSLVVDSSKHNPNSIFYDSEVVFTGSLESMTRKEALQKVAEIGGVPGDLLRTSTNYLVCGKRDLDKISADKMTGKYKKAVDFASKGYDIEIIDENTFFQNL